MTNWRNDIEKVHLFNVILSMILGFAIGFISGAVVVFVKFYNEHIEMIP